MERLWPAWKGPEFPAKEDVVFCPTVTVGPWVGGPG